MDVYLQTLLGDVIVSLIGAGPLQAPMTKAEVYAQHLYTDDCQTTRDGIAMSCQAAFIQDLDRAYAFDERKKNGTRN